MCGECRKGFDEAGMVLFPVHPDRLGSIFCTDGVVAVCLSCYHSLAASGQKRLRSLRQSPAKNAEVSGSPLPR